MLGIIIGLVISWVLLYFLQGVHLSVLGFTPFFKRIGQISFGVITVGLLCVLVQLMEGAISQSTWVVNKGFSLNKLVSMFLWDVKSVFTEELIFRGAILYILIQKIGELRAILISAVLFGIYHWFIMGVFGNIFPMVVVFLGTGTMGFAWSVAFSKTRSMALPFGLHLGWNFVHNSVFSKGPLGEGFLLFQRTNPIGDWYSLVGLWLVPIIVLAMVWYAVPGHDEGLKLSKAPSNS